MIALGIWELLWALVRVFAVAVVWLIGVLIALACIVWVGARALAHRSAR